MKMSKNTLLKKIGQGYRENYCNGEYTLNLVTENKEVSTYVLKYTYETGEEIAITITASYLGQVSFYSNTHHYYISNFNNHTKSVINVMRTLFDLIECNKDDMLKWYTVEETADTAQSEEPILDTIISDDCMKTVLNMEELFSQMFGNTIRSKCKMYSNSSYGCPADRQGNRCGGKQWCKQTWKRYGAIVNPEWHHVGIATLANIDFDMLDEKRKLVFDINQILKDGIRNLYKCENHISFEVLERYVIRKCDELIRHNRLKAFWFSYIARQLDEVRRNTIYLYTPYITAHRNRW